jgi:hypothetical protein
LQDYRGPMCFRHPLAFLVLFRHSQSVTNRTAVGLPLVPVVVFDKREMVSAPKSPGHGLTGTGKELLQELLLSIPMRLLVGVVACLVRAG